MLNEQTYTETRKQLAQDLKQQVCKFLEWDEMDYAQFQFNAGQNYLIYYTGNDEEIISELESSKMFWNWWKNNWVNREQVFVEHAGQCYDKQGCLRMYIMIHDARALSNDLYPDLEALGIGELITK